MSHSAGWQAHNPTRLMRREIESRMAALDLTDAQWRPLWVLASGRIDTANEMARLLEMDAGAMTVLLDRLEAKGLVERLPSGADRRVVHLQLTAAGRAAAAQVPQVLAEVNNRFLKGFSEAEWAQLRALIERMAANETALLAARGYREGQVAGAFASVLGDAVARDLDIHRRDDRGRRTVGLSRPRLASRTASAGRRGRPSAGGRRLATPRSTRWSNRP